MNYTVLGNERSRYKTYILNGVCGGVICIELSERDLIFGVRSDKQNVCHIDSKFVNEAVGFAGSCLSDDWGWLGECESDRIPEFSKFHGFYDTPDLGTTTTEFIESEFARIKAVYDQNVNG